MYECSWPPVYWPCFFITNLVAPSQTECACEKQPSRDLLTGVATQTGETGETGKAESFKVLPSGVGEGETHCVFPHLGSLFSKMTAGNNCRNFQLTHLPPSPPTCPSSTYPAFSDPHAWRLLHLEHGMHACVWCLPSVKTITDLCVVPWESRTLLIPKYLL